MQHECSFPWSGTLQQCMIEGCDIWWQVTVFTDPETNESWKTWTPVDTKQEGDPSNV